MGAGMNGRGAAGVEGLCPSSEPLPSRPQGGKLPYPYPLLHMSLRPAGLVKKPGDLRGAARPLTRT
jgi:hypothetical protein